MSDNKVSYGLKNAHYAKITEALGVRSYGTPVAMPGAVTLNLDPQGEKTEFYADNVAYFVAEKNSGYTGNLVLAVLPDAYKKDILNYKEDENGALFEDANALPSKFALLFEFDGDAKATRHVLYDVTPGRSAVTGKTKEKGIEVQTSTIPITAGPDPDTGSPKAEIKYGQTGYDTFFASVYEFVPVVEG